MRFLRSGVMDVAFYVAFDANTVMCIRHEANLNPCRKHDVPCVSGSIILTTCRSHLTQFLLLIYLQNVFNKLRSDPIDARHSTSFNFWSRYVYKPDSLIVPLNLVSSTRTYTCTFSLRFLLNHER